MKRFLSAIFILTLLLCQNVGASQTKTDPSGNSDPPSPTIIEKQNPTDEYPKPHQEISDVKDQEVVGDQGTSMIERVKQLANKPNLALLVSALASIFAGLSWKAGRDTVKVARDGLRDNRESNERQLRAYLGATQISFGRTQDGFLEFVTKINNFGATPATHVWVELDASFMTANRTWKPLKVGTDFDVIIMPNQEVDVHFNGISPERFFKAAPDGARGFDHVEVSGKFSFKTTFDNTFVVNFNALTSGLRGDMNRHPKGITVLDDISSGTETQIEEDNKDD